LCLNIILVLIMKTEVFGDFNMYHQSSREITSCLAGAEFGSLVMGSLPN
jgi:hypothetical protein